MEKFLESRREHEQVKQLVEDAKQAAAVEEDRRAQAAADDWFLSEAGRRNGSRVANVGDGKLIELLPNREGGFDEQYLAAKVLCPSLSRADRMHAVQLSGDTDTIGEFPPPKLNVGARHRQTGRVLGWRGRRR